MKLSRQHWKILVGIVGIILLTVAVFLADQRSTVLPENGTHSKAVSYTHLDVYKRQELDKN